MVAVRPKVTRRRGQHRRAPGPFYSEAARRLWGVLDDLGLATNEAAARARVSGTTVLRWLYGERRADAAGQLVCHEEFGIEPKLWFVKPKGKLALELPQAKALAQAPSPPAAAE